MARPKSKVFVKPDKKASENNGRVLLSKDYLVLYEKELINTSKRKQKYQLRVCSWNGAPPVLEKRLMVLDLVSGKYYPYKQMGINYDDLKIIMDNIPDIMSSLMKKGELSDDLKEKKKDE